MQTPLLRHGAQTPRPLNEADILLQFGQFAGPVTKLSENGTSTLLSCKVEFLHTDVRVLVKPTESLPTRLRGSIPEFRDNRSADAAFHISTFVDLVDTPAHVIRDDAPVVTTADGGRLGAAGVQIFVAAAHEPTSEERKAVYKEAAFRAELERAAVFDTLIGNMDRHKENWLLRDSTAIGPRIVAIDHSLCFPVRATQDRGSEFIDMYLMGSSQGVLSAGVIRELDQLLARRTLVSRALSLSLEPIAIQRLWERCLRLLRTGLVFRPD